MTAVDLLRRQLQEAYDRLRTRVEGLTDDEFFWEPVPDCWTVRQDDRGHWAADFPDEPHPVPAPFTTIAWRLVHVALLVRDLAGLRDADLDQPRLTNWGEQWRRGVCFGR